MLADAVLGVSMGNFAAATVAGSLAPEAALQAIAAQARALDAHAEPGGMLAVLGNPEQHGQHPLLREHSEVAAVNTPSSYVLALPESSRELIEGFLRERNINFQRMAVSRAFHSRWIDAAAEAHPPIALGPARLPWYCASASGLVAAPPADYFWQVVRQPIRMVETLRVLEASGEYDYLDLGPAGTLSVLLRYLLMPGSKAQHMSVMSAFGSDIKRFDEVVAAQRERHPCERKDP